MHKSCIACSEPFFQQGGHISAQTLAPVYALQSDKFDQAV